MGVPVAPSLPIETRITEGTAWSEIVPGAKEVLEELERRQLRVAIISNTFVAGVVSNSLARAGLCQVARVPLLR